MNPDGLGTALRDLVDDVEDGATPPLADDLWAGGRRRRHTSQALPLLAAACVAAVVGLLVWPTGQPRASVPSIGVDDSGAVRLSAFPSAIAKPPVVARTDRPGVTAAVLTEGSDVNRTYAVSPTGSVSRLALPEGTPGTPPSLSPDGRWLARGPVLTDLVRGITIPGLTEREALASSRMPADESAWWSPDSRRIYVDAFNQGEPTSSGLVVDTDGTVTEAPLLLDGGSSPIVAGWLDEQTLLAFVDIGSGLTVLQARTWRVGDAAWEVAEALVSWPPLGLDGTETGQDLRASLSPDRSRLLMTALVTDPDITENLRTQAMMFDPVTGTQLGMPQGDGVVDPEKWAPGSYAEWRGWGCRPAWNDGLPVVTDGGVMAFVDPDPGGLIDGTVDYELVSVSGRYEEPCVAFAGDELRGTPVANTAAVWQERVWVWGGRVLVLGGLGSLVWWFTRGRSWREGSEPPRPFLPLRG